MYPRAVSPPPLPLNTSPGTVNTPRQRKDLSRPFKETKHLNSQWFFVREACQEFTHNFSQMFFFKRIEGHRVIGETS